MMLVRLGPAESAILRRDMEHTKEDIEAAEKFAYVAPECFEGAIPMEAPRIDQTAFEAFLAGILHEREKSEIDKLAETLVQALKENAKLKTQLEKVQMEITELKAKLGNAREFIKTLPQTEHIYEVCDSRDHNGWYNGHGEYCNICSSYEPKELFKGYKNTKAAEALKELEQHE